MKTPPPPKKLQLSSLIRNQSSDFAALLLLHQLLILNISTLQADQGKMPIPFLRNLTRKSFSGLNLQ